MIKESHSYKLPFLKPGEDHNYEERKKIIGNAVVGDYFVVSNYPSNLDMKRMIVDGVKPSYVQMFEVTGSPHRYTEQERCSHGHYWGYIPMKRC
jgi:hypothetical protein